MNTFVPYLLGLSNHKNVKYDKEKPKPQQGRREGLLNAFSGRSRTGSASPRNSEAHTFHSGGSKGTWAMGLCTTSGSLKLRALI